MNWILILKMHTTETAILIFILGAMIGSFLNVVIYRYPIMLTREWNRECLLQLNMPTQPEENFNLSLPRSHCPSCKKTIPFWLNIPILSFLLLRGKCANCHARISIQYFLVEIISGLLPVMIFMHFGLTAHAAALILFTWGLIALSFIDFNHQFLPDQITYSLLWLGLFLSVQGLSISPLQAVYASLIGYLFLWSIAKLYLLIKNKEGMGLGDCKMLAMMGAWTGVLSLINVLLISTIAALCVNLLLILFKKVDSENPIPFGPYIAIAGWCTAVYGNQLLNWIFRCL